MRERYHKQKGIQCANTAKHPGNQSSASRVQPADYLILLGDNSYKMWRMISWMLTILSNLKNEDV